MHGVARGGQFWLGLAVALRLLWTGLGTVCCGSAVEAMPGLSWCAVLRSGDAWQSCRVEVCPVRERRR